jgi:hypothetical protein
LKPVVLCPVADCGNFRDFYQIDPDLSNKKMLIKQLPAKMRLKGPECCDQDARSRLLADPAAAPTLLERPLLEGALPADDVPKARPGRRAYASDRLDGFPHCIARRFDAQAGLISVVESDRAAVPWP